MLYICYGLSLTGFRKQSCSPHIKLESNFLITCSKWPHPSGIYKLSLSHTCHIPCCSSLPVQLASTVPYLLPITNDIRTSWCVWDLGPKCYKMAKSWHHLFARGCSGYLISLSFFKETTHLPDIYFLFVLNNKTIAPMNISSTYSDTNSSRVLYCICW